MKLVEELKTTIEPIIGAMGLDLVDLKIHGQGKRTIVRVYIDQMGGVNIDQCARASRAIEEALDRMDFFEEHYVLEVSSPGTDRPLKTEQDFRRHIGRKVRVRVELEQNLREFTGIIVDARDGLITLSNEQGLQYLPLNSLLSSRLIVELTDRPLGKQYEK